MINELQFASQWWVWWSNPLIGIHPEQKVKLGLAPSASNDLDYFQLLQLRSSLSLADIPEEGMLQKPDLCYLALANSSQLEAHFISLAVWSLDSGILHARAQDWEANYGVTSPQTIREIIESRKEISSQLYVWHDSFAGQLRMLHSQALHVSYRSLLGLGIYLKSFTPQFYERWVLTQSATIQRVIGQLDPIPVDSQESADQWITPCLKNLIQEIQQAFPADDLEMAEFNELDEFSIEDNSAESIGGETHA
jgi:hypothetical protein